MLLLLRLMEKARIKFKGQVLGVVRDKNKNLGNRFFFLVFLNSVVPTVFH